MFFKKINIVIIIFDIKNKLKKLIQIISKIYIYIYKII